MAAISGKDAFATGLTGVQSWTINKTVTQNRHSHSGVAGKTDVHKGNIDYAGSIVCCADELQTMFPTGSDVSSVQFTIDNTTATGKDSVTGNIRVESLTIDYNAASPDPVMATVAFGVQGNLTAAATGAAQGSDLSAPSALNLVVEIDDIDLADLTDGICIQQAQLVFRRPLGTHFCSGYAQRTSGNLEVDCTLTVVDDDPWRSLWSQETPAKLFVSADGGGTGWEIQNIRWGGFGQTVARTADALVYTVSGQWVGVSGTIDGPSATSYIA